MVVFSTSQQFENSTRIDCVQFLLGFYQSSLESLKKSKRTGRKESGMDIRWLCNGFHLGFCNRSFLRFTWFFWFTNTKHGKSCSVPSNSEVILAVTLLKHVSCGVMGIIDSFDHVKFTQTNEIADLLNELYIIIYHHLCHLCVYTLLCLSQICTLANVKYQETYQNLLVRRYISDKQISINLAADVFAFIRQRGLGRARSKVVFGDMKAPGGTEVDRETRWLRVDFRETRSSSSQVTTVVTHHSHHITPRSRLRLWMVCHVRCWWTYRSKWICRSWRHIHCWNIWRCWETMKSHVYVRRL